MLILTVAAVLRPAVAIAGINCMYPLQQLFQAKSAFFMTHYVLINYSMGVLLLFSLCMIMIRERGQWLPFKNYPAIGKLVFAMFIYAYASVFWAFDPSVSTAQLLKNIPYLITGLVLMPLLIVRAQDLWSALLATMVLGALVALALLSVPVENRFLIGATGEEFGNPLALGDLGAYVFIIAALLNFRGLSRFWQIVRFPVMGIALAVAVRSDSRGQIIAAVIVVALFLPMSRPVGSIRSQLALIIGFIGVGAALYWAFSTFGTVSDRWEWDRLRETYTETRLGTTMKLLGFWINGGPLAWIMGLGNSASWSPMINGIYPHFVPGEMLAEEGLIGAGFFISYWALCLRSIVRTYRSVRPFDDARGVLAAISALLFFTLITACKSGSMLDPSLWGFGIMLGMFELSVRRAQQQAAAQQAIAVPVQPMQQDVVGARLAT